ncbi:hypothetical protein GQ53DRAFT_63862 [Thozetella sp. PMI_491]|nr:hypothetical protein GQ53DRAFT_63862 [Thozetella sp. PMI_491]
MARLSRWIPTLGCPLVCPGRVRTSSGRRQSARFIGRVAPSGNQLDRDDRDCPSACRRRRTWAFRLGGLLTMAVKLGLSWASPHSAITNRMRSSRIQ